MHACDPSHVRRNCGKSEGAPRLHRFFPCTNTSSFLALSQAHRIERLMFLLFPSILSVSLSMAVLPIRAEVSFLLDCAVWFDDDGLGFWPLFLLTACSRHGRGCDEDIVWSGSGQDFRYARPRARAATCKIAGVCVYLLEMSGDRTGQRLRGSRVGASFPFSLSSISVLLVCVALFFFLVSMQLPTS